ncbi:neurofilament medium polypeptide-like [Bradysia coprophila]|uniref:neurofilament medium polypeptide-like n=1 Tax=Bradysia coprophila TaxID=38358 RepID=UPI00187DC45A|nr:neurofilament medium polypeptide-like [Bradysia coprophila]
MVRNKSKTKLSKKASKKKNKTKSKRIKKTEKAKGETVKEKSKSDDKERRNSKETAKESGDVKESKEAKEKRKESGPSKKSSISIEVKKDTENLPKTVKTFNSKFRSHGLAEEAPPPPSRRGLQRPSSQPTAGASIPGTTVTKRPSPPPEKKDAVVPEKKLKIDTSLAVEKPGIKLIPAKPKSEYLSNNSSNLWFCRLISDVKFGIGVRWHIL